MSARFSIAAMAILFALATPASALELRPYAFVTGGASELDLGELEERVESVAELASGNGGTGTVDLDKRSTVASVGLGLQLHRYFAVELGYYHLGSYDVEANGNYSNGRGEITANGSAKVKVRGYGLQGVFIAPITDRLSGTLSLGVAQLETDIEGSHAHRYETSAGQVNEHENYDLSLRETVANLGLGVHYVFNNRLGLRLDYHYLGDVGNIYETEESLNMVSAGLTFHF